MGGRKMNDTIQKADNNCALPLIPSPRPYSCYYELSSLHLPLSPHRCIVKNPHMNVNYIAFALIRRHLKLGPAPRTTLSGNKMSM